MSRRGQSGSKMPKKSPKSSMVHVESTMPTGVISEAGPDHTPTEFETYFPWACLQLNLTMEVFVEKFSEVQEKKVTVGKHSLSLRDLRSALERSVQPEKAKKSDGVHILATYEGESLYKLTFGTYIPQAVMKLLGLIIGYYPKLTTIVVKKGLNNYAIHELAAILSGATNLSALYFDGCAVPGVTFHTLLDPTSHLTELYLARCSIGDDMLALICERLKYPFPSSKTLAVLQIASNHLTDVGAKHLGQCLRSNRTLRYINFADNHITDLGAREILDSLKKFPLTEDETAELTQKYTVYLKKKLVNVISERVRCPSVSLNKKKTIKKGSIHENSADRPPDLVEFIHPFAPSENSIENGHQICNGNFALCYLNLAYNHLTVFSLQKILEVLYFQRLTCEDTGLINLRLDGNPLPMRCDELVAINSILDQKLSQLSMAKKAAGKRKA